MPGARAAATGEGLPPRPPSATPGPGRQTFEDSMVHEVLCVTRRFTACCALHRCLSRGVLHDDVSGLGWGLGRRGASRHSCSVAAEERHSAPSSLVRPHPLVCCLLRCLAAPQRAPPSECAPPKGLWYRQLDSFAPRFSLVLPFLVEPPASPRRTARGRRRRCHCCMSTVASRAGCPARVRQTSIMILLQVLLQKPCYDFSFL